MILRILEKDVRIALQKLEKLPLELQIRKVTKDIDGNKYSGSDNLKCDKREQILAKLFPMQDTQPAVYATSAKSESEKLEQRLETIEERPLVEAESSQGLEFPPKVLGQSGLRPSHVQRSWQSTEDATFDEIACKLMNSPPQEIDRRLLEAYNFTTLDTHQAEKDELDLQPTNNRETEVSRCVDQDLIDGVIESTFPRCSLEYSVDMSDEDTNRTWKAERPQPTHYGAEYATYIEKGTLRHKVLRELEDLGGALVPQSELMLVPLPPNQTSISSCESPPSTLKIEEWDDNANSTSISFHTLPRNIMQRSREGRRETAEFVTYFSTPVCSTPNINAGQVVKKEDFDRVPLSVLLKWARQRSMAEREMKKDRTLKGARYMSKGTCLPPLDKRPRGKTCPPRACPPTRKEMPCPPPKDPCSTTKKTTCPPQKMPCPPPKKPPCPPPKDPCAKSPCDPCKSPPPCPPKQKPCGLIIGNRIKETISLILSAYVPLSSHRLLTNIDTIHRGKNSMSTVVLCPEVLAASPLLGLRKLGKDVCPECSPPVGGLKNVALARSFDPWAPIPSWPMPKKEAQKRLICPKEGCPPPKPPKDPCREQPCDTAKHRKFTAGIYPYC